MNILQVNATEVNRILNAQNDYEVLGLDRGASLNEIMDSFRKLILKYHPDKVPNEDKKIFQELTNRIVNAKNTLTRQINHHPLPSGTKHASEPMGAQLPFTKGLYDIAQYSYKNLFSSGMSLLFTRAFNTIGHLTGEPSNALVPQEETEVAFHMAFSQMICDVLYDDDILCLGLTLSWIKFQAEGRESIFIQTMKSGYSPITMMDIYALASLINPLIQSKQIEERVEERRVSECFDDASEDKDLYMATPIRMSWNYNFLQFQSMLISQIKLSPNIPFLIYNRAGEQSRYIAIIFNGQDYTAFSPYEPAFTATGDSIAVCDENMLVEILRAHYYPSDPAAKIPIAITSFISMPIDQKPQELALIRASYSGSELVLGRENFTQYILKEFFPDSIDSARRILEAIRDGHLSGFLKEVYPKGAEFFTRELFLEFIDQAVETNAYFIPLEICTLLDDEPLRSFYAAYYINRYLEKTAHFGLLEKITQAFNEHGIDLTDKISTTNRNHNTFLDKRLLQFIPSGAKRAFVYSPEQELHKLEHLYSLVRLGIRPTLKQLERVLAKITQVMQRNHTTSNFGLYKTDKQYARKANEDLKAFVKLLADNNIYLGSTPLLSLKQSLAYGLMKIQEEEFLISLFERNAISAGTVDLDGKTILNYFSREKSWTLVVYLLQKGAPFSTGKHISYKEIPGLHGMIEKVPELKFVYSQYTPESLNSLIIKQIDVYAVLLRQKTDPDFLKGLQRQFLGEINQRLIPYSYQSISDIKQFKELLALSGLKDSAEVQTMQPPKTYQSTDYILRRSLQPSTKYTHLDEVPDLIGLNRIEAESVISKLYQRPVFTIQVHNNPSVFYGTDMDFLNQIIPKLSRHTLWQYYKDLTHDLKRKSGLHDLGALINILTFIFQEAKKLLADLQTPDWSKIFLIDPAYQRSKYENTLASLFNSQASICIKLIFDVSGRVSSYFCMLDPSQAHHETDNMFIDKSARMEYRSEWVLYHLHLMKQTLEYSTPLRFTPSCPPDNLSILSSRIPKEIAKWKKENPKENKCVIS